MPHIQLSDPSPGIVGLLNSFPETGEVLRQLAETLLRKPGSLSAGEREMIAAAVSFQNECQFCSLSHAAAAQAHYNFEPWVLDACRGKRVEELSPKMEALLTIARKVAVSGREVAVADVETAKAAGATDSELHHAVLIAAAFCMFNRYVDGLATLSSPNAEDYWAMGEKMAKSGYCG